MPEAYNLRRMLDEIIEDERVSTSKTKRVSQDDIKKLLNERQNSRHEGRDPVASASGESSTPPEQIEHDPASTSQDPEPGHSPGDASTPFGLSGPLPGGILQRSGDPWSHEGSRDSSSHFQRFRIPPDLLPTRLMLKSRIIPLHVGARAVELAMEDPSDSAAIHHVETLTGKRVEPVRIDPEQLNRLLELLAAERVPTGFRSASSHRPEAGEPLSTLLEMLVISQGSDLIISQGASPWIRTAAGVEHTGLPALDALECVQCARSIMTEVQWERFLAEGVVGFSWEAPAQGRFRIQVFRERSVPSMVIRYIPDPLPTMEELGLPGWLQDTTKAATGLIIITGPSGHGKTTTLHALVHGINAHRACHIVTLEDPVEFVHRSRMSTVSQREIGTDVGSCREGIKQARRHGADVIVVWELCSSEVFLEALASAQAGRLVLTTLEAAEPRQALKRLIDAVPAHWKSEAESMIGEGTVLIVAQKLLQNRDGARGRLVCEKLEGGSGLRDSLESAAADSRQTVTDDRKPCSERGGQESRV